MAKYVFEVESDQLQKDELEGVLAICVGVTVINSWREMHDSDYDDGLDGRTVGFEVVVENEADQD